MIVVGSVSAKFRWISDDAGVGDHRRTAPGDQRQILPLLPIKPKVFLQTGEANLPVLRLVVVLETPPGALAAALHADGTQTGILRDDNEPSGSAGGRSA